MSRKKCIPDTDAENARLETNKAYLSQYARLFFRKKGRAARIRSMRQEADAVASVWGEHVSGGAQTAPYVIIVEKIESEEAKLRQEELLLGLLDRQIQQMLETLPSPQMQRILFSRYLLPFPETYTRLACELSADRRTVQRMEIKALKQLHLPENPISIGER